MESQVSVVDLKPSARRLRTRSYFRAVVRECFSGLLNPSGARGIELDQKIMPSRGLKVFFVFVDLLGILFRILWWLLMVFSEGACMANGWVLIVAYNMS